MLITLLLVFHVLLAIFLIGVVLLQKSEGGALGSLGGGGGGGGGFMTARGSANLLTRATAVLAALFMITSLTLVILSGPRTTQRSIVDQPVPTQPAAPPAPSVPLAR
jgi:preprotein translocase subunit SecG